MLRIAGQTAGLIGLKFFVDTHGGPEGVIGLENSTFKEKFLAFFSNFFNFFSNVLSTGNDGYFS